ncbi:MAG TPA: DUF4349 domain-containing protein, partial [Gemmataceae bacterium]|nr:DUF4349 domain-containing protein [Gemmataceae bacterium]
TDKYYDLQAHIKTNEVEEEGLQKLYLEKSASAKLPDLIPIRHELREIRGEIEAQKGQLTRWDKETQYATVTVNLQDRKDYVPPTSPDFGTSIARTFQGSIGALVDFGKAIVIAAVALAPWLPLLAAVIVPVWLLFRRLARRLPGGGTPTP